MNSNVRLWYLLGFIDGRVVHVEHDVYGLDNGSDKACELAQSWFDRGLFIDGTSIIFDRVVAVSEDHETALDISRGK